MRLFYVFESFHSFNQDRNTVINSIHRKDLRFDCAYSFDDRLAAAASAIIWFISLETCFGDRPVGYVS